MQTSVVGGGEKWSASFHAEKNKVDCSSIGTPNAAPAVLCEGAETAWAEGATGVVAAVCTVPLSRMSMDRMLSGIGNLSFNIRHVSSRPVTTAS